MIQSGIPFNIQEGSERQYKLLNSYLEMLVNLDDGAQRKIDKAAVHNEDISGVKPKESALN
jgi:hypothetical protein